MNITLVFAALTLFLSFSSRAQTLHVETAQQETHLQLSESDYDHNIVKLNLTGIALKTYSLSYERLLSRKISAGIGLGYRPSGKIPLLGSLESAINNKTTYAHLQKLDIGTWSATPEIRFYFSKHDGARGFYLAPFARYSRYQLRFDSFNFASDSQPPSPSEDLPAIDLKGNITGLTGGLMFGAQWRLGKRAYLDWWIAGAGYGSSKGQLSGTAPLNEEAQGALKQELDALELPFVGGEAEVNADGARMNLKGPWGDFRAGISIGMGL